MAVVVAVEDSRRNEVRALLERHLAFSREVSPPDHVHALDIDGVLDPAFTFFSARGDGVLLGVGALKELDASHGELKSMHTVETARAQGTGRAMVDHLLSVAADPELSTGQSGNGSHGCLRAGLLVVREGRLQTV